MRTLCVSLALLAFLVGLSCGGRDDVGADGDVVGGRCRSNADCAQRCLTGGAWPGGHCTVSCVTDRDCPRGTACVDREGGVCLLSCAEGQDCRRLDPDYQCTSQRLRLDGDLRALVCTD